MIQPTGTGGAGLASSAKSDPAAGGQPDLETHESSASSLAKVESRRPARAPRLSSAIELPEKPSADRLRP
jgi:hypothetical protein